MSRLLRVLMALGTVVVPASIYSWGQGYFYPCGPLDRFFQLSNCTVIAHWSHTIVEAVGWDSDEKLTGVLRSSEDSPSTPQRLVSVTQGGGVSEPTTLQTDTDRSWASIRLSPDGTALLASFNQDIVRLFDRETGQEIAAFDGTYGADKIGFTSDGKVLVATDSGSFDRPVSQSALRFNIDGSANGKVEGAAALPVNAGGIASALTPDGMLMVQHEKTLKDTGIVALRVIEPQFASWAGSLMIAPITGWMDQILPRIWISPDSRYVAASFDSSEEWGKVNSALAVWELESRNLVTLVPTWRAHWENVVWLPGGRLAASRYNIDWHDSQIAIISYASNASTTEPNEQ